MEKPGVEKRSQVACHTFVGVGQAVYFVRGNELAQALSGLVKRASEAYSSGVLARRACGWLFEGKACEDEPADCRHNDNKASKPCPKCMARHKEASNLQKTVQKMFVRLMLDRALQRPNAAETT